MIDTKDLRIVNYCHPNCIPLRNILWLPREEAFRTAARLAAENPDATAFGRFADFENYYPRRMETDHLLYEDFLSKGGQPEVEHPLSFVLQGSDYLYRWFDQGTIITQPLADIPDEVVSFTLGDSMSAPRPDGQIHVLTKPDLLRKVSDYQGTLDEFMQEISATCHYIEVQVWRKLTL
ncbi:MAG: hypothetical protein E7316_08535 [Clostridiales bacterium]|nr:hypothetical protein [Clostridiales bacterium]